MGRKKPTEPRKTKNGMYRADPAVLRQAMADQNIGDAVVLASRAVIDQATAHKMLAGGWHFPGIWDKVAVALDVPLDRLLVGYAPRPKNRATAKSAPEAFDVDVDGTKEALGALLADPEKLVALGEALIRLAGASKKAKLVDVKEGSVRLRFVGTREDYERFVRALRDWRAVDFSGVELHARLRDQSGEVVFIPGAGDRFANYHPRDDGTGEFPAIDVPPGVHNTPADDSQDERIVAVKRAGGRAEPIIDALPPEVREVVKLRLSGHSRAAVAAALGLSPSTADLYFANAMTSVQEALARGH